MCTYSCDCDVSYLDVHGTSLRVAVVGEGGKAPCRTQGAGDVTCGAPWTETHPTQNPNLNSDP